MAKAIRGTDGYEPPAMITEVRTGEARFRCEKYPFLKVLVDRVGGQDEFAEFQMGECRTSDPRAIAVLRQTEHVYELAPDEDANLLARLTCPRCGAVSKNVSAAKAHLRAHDEAERRAREVGEPRVEE